MSNAPTLIALANGAAVSVFGSVLSASFCGVLGVRRSRRIFWLGMALLLLFQGAVYLFLGAGTWQRIYPLMIHLPLLALLHGLTGKWLWPGIAIVSAYLFCQMRRWLALLAAAVLPGEEAAQQLAELALTAPLLLLFLRFASPGVRQLMDYPVKNQCQFGLIPALYYGFDYLTRIYTGLLSGDSPVVEEFMPTVCCAAYLIFLLYNSAEERKRERLQQVQGSLGIQLAQAVREISALRESQAMSAQHRHDLRHHMQYLAACIENGQKERALRYISGICREIESQTVRRYCENDAANLILSAFSGRAEKAGVAMRVQGRLPSAIPVSDSDLCVLLSNSLENALHACQPLAEAGAECVISVRFTFHDRKNRLFMLVENPCGDGVRFENGLPVSGRPGHGIGVQSICAIVEQYGGVCSFAAEDGKFTLRLFL